jgi:hypothetical protein
VTKIFDFISHHGWEITRKRAIKHSPLYAERDAKRREGQTNTIRFLDDYFTMEMHEEEHEIEKKYRPWWLIASLHVHWWLGRHGPTTTYYDIKAFWQRGKRGWSNSDAWSFDTYLAKVIRDGVQHLNDTKHGWPGEPMTYEEWGQILTEISEGMQAHIEIADVFTEQQRLPALEAKRALAFTHLAAYFPHLWD